MVLQGDGGWTLIWVPEGMIRVSDRLAQLDRLT